MMETKKEIVTDWLKRYTGREPEAFASYILLCNFSRYLELFAQEHKVPIVGQGLAMPNAGTEEITLIHFGMGSPNAATMMDLLSAIMPRGVLFLGKCGALKSRLSVGDYLLPIAAIRGEGTSNSYLPAEVPSLPSFRILRAADEALERRRLPFAAGTVYTTNRRVWEHDYHFKRYLRTTHAEAIDMETATLFTVGYANKIPCGALLAVSDLPMTPDGVKTDIGDKETTQRYTAEHLAIGEETLHILRYEQQCLKGIRFDW